MSAAYDVARVIKYFQKPVSYMARDTWPDSISCPSSPRASALTFRGLPLFPSEQSLRKKAMRKKLGLCVSSIFLLPLSAVAGQQVCGNLVVPASARSCPDGSIPMYVADEIKPYVPPQSVQTPSRAPKHNDLPISGSSDLNYYLGVWRTRIPGAVWTSPSGYRDHDWLHVSTGVSAGDLIIRPNGTYVWNSYGGKAGRWVHGDSEYPIVLIDTVENRHWKVGADPKHTGGRDIMVWDGNSIYYDGRK